MAPKPYRKDANVRRYEVLHRDMGGKSNLIDLPHEYAQFANVAIFQWHIVNHEETKLKTHMFRRTVQTLSTSMAIAGVLVAVPAPAYAASGGGCKDTSVIGACISFQRPQVISDFYMNSDPDYSRCIAVLGIFQNGELVKTETYELNRMGRYGPISSLTETLPPSGGSAFTRVGVYTCDWDWQFYADSPTIDYP